MVIEQSSEPGLTENERKRIREEMRYAMLVLEERHPAEKPKNSLSKILGYLSNGFVLLLLGSLITSVLVPKFQREYESRARQAAAMQECLSQFLVYSNSVQQEYYRILPVVQESEIDKEQYINVLNDISVIKLKRYDAYAKILALAIVFRGQNSSEKSIVEKELVNYAIGVNENSHNIDGWLREMYCTPTQRLISPCVNFNPTFNSYEGYIRIKDDSEKLGNVRLEHVAELMARQIKKPN